MRQGVSAILLISALLLVGCGGPPPEAQPTSIPPTPFSTPTPLPPMARPPARGSDANPHRFVLVSEQAISETDLNLLANQMSAAHGGAITLVQVESYAQAREELCSGRAEVALLDAFNTLAARADDCGDLRLVAEIDGATATLGNFVARDTFRPEFNAGIFCRASADSVHGWVIPRLYLLSKGKDPLEFPAIIDLGSDEAVIAGVLDRSCQMGATQAGAEANLGDLPDLRFLQLLPAIPALPAVPNAALLISNRLEGDARAEMEDMVADFDDEVAGLLGVDGLVETSDTDYEPLAALFEAAGVEVRSLAR